MAKQRFIIIGALLLSFLSALAPSATALTPHASSSVTTTAVAPATALMAATPVTHKCTTPGSAGLIDSLFVTRTQNLNGSWHYRGERSPDRSTVVRIGTSNDYFYPYHTAVVIKQYWSSDSVTPMRTITKPPRVFTTNSRSPHNSFFLRMSLTTDAVRFYFRSCIVAF